MGETDNRAAREPERVASLARALGSYLRGVDAQMPVDSETGAAVPWPDRL